MMQPDLTPAQAREQLETARREAAEATSLVTELADRVRDGDTDVTAEQMAGQKQLAELAQLRITAAERKLAAAVSADLDARARATADRARALVDEDSTAPVLDAVRAVAGAVRTLMQVSADRHDAIRQVATEGVLMNEELGRSDNEPFPSRAYGFMASTLPELNITAVDQGHARAIPAGRVLGLVLRAVLDRDSQRKATEMLGLSVEGLARHTDAIAGLAEVLAEDPHAGVEG